MRRSLAKPYGRARSVAQTQSRLPRRAVTALLVACVFVLALGAGVAQAAPKGVIDFFGATGTPGQGGQFNAPRGVAVRQSTDDIYVVDSSNHRVQRFNASGFVSAWGRDVITGDPTGFEICIVAMTCKIGSTGPPPPAPPDGPAGELSSPQGIAVDQVDGSVYVTDQGNLRVQKFDKDGNFIYALGKDVDTVDQDTGDGGTDFEICTASCKQGAAPGTLGATGGAFAGTFSGHVAVNPVNRNLVVADPGNRRVQEFTSAGAFVRAWGFDVVKPGGTGNIPVNERQTVTVVATGGTFTLTFSGQTTNPPIAFDATAAEVEAALEGLSNLDPGDVTVTGDAGGPWTVEFEGARADTDLAQMTGDAANLAGDGASVTVATPTQGSGVLEVCTVVADCKIAAASGAAPGQFANSQPTRVAVDSSGSIYTVESAGNFRVQKFTPAADSSGVFAAAHVSGTNSSTAPTDVAVDPTNDHVLVTKAAGSPVERQVLELDLGGSLLDTHAVGAGLPATNGLAVRGSTGRLYLSTSINQRVFVLGQVTPPSATIGAVSNITATSATLNGTVNPNGAALDTFYRFEFREEGTETWTRVPASDQPVPDGTTDQPVSQPIGLAPNPPLEPNTQYRVRLVATRQFAGGSATSAEQTFTTNPAPPSISDVGAREVTDTTALLAGRVDPNRSHTTYRFEYGTDTSYGSATAVDNAGSGAAPGPVSKAIAGLQPNTTYHFRLVASNAAGQTEGPDQTFTTKATPPQPSGRAYEMVSPLDKNGGDVNRDNVFGLTHQSGAAPSGDAAAFVSRLQFGDIESGALAPVYVARRGETGWGTEGVTPPIGHEIPGGQSEEPAVNGLSRDLSKAFVKASPELAPGAENLGGSWGLYLRRNGEPDPYTLLSFPSTVLRTDVLEDPFLTSTRFTYVADTPDSRHVVFNAERQLLPGAPDEPAAPAPLPNHPTRVYEWIDGSLRFVSVPPPDVASFDFSTDVTAGAADRRGDGDLPGDHVISDDGRRVFFTATVPGRGPHLFVRENGTTTVHVSRSELAGGPYVGGTNPRFWAAKHTDGSVAIFTSGVPLTQGAGSGALYRWDANAEEGDRLMEIHSGVSGVAAVNDDATSVAYVVGSGVDRDLYLWRQAEGVRHIAKVDGTTRVGGGGDRDDRLWFGLSDVGGRAARISADGERLLFASFAKQPDVAYDITETTAEACGNPSAPAERCRQIYLYDARRDELSCLTCVPGVPVTGNANLFGNSEARPGEPHVNAPYRQPRNLSGDGTRAYFETARPLVSGDRNTNLDVYEWDDRDLDGQGELRLISPGRGPFDSKFLDASVSGDDVFFTTREQLVGIDTDNQVDLYDARVGGGIPAQNPPPVSPCQGDACQGARAGAPFLPGVASGGASNGDARPGRRASFSVARLSRRQLTRLARGRAVPVRVRVSRPGKVTLRARAKVGKRMLTVAGASKRARKAGTVTLQLKLARSARRALARKGRMNVRLAVRFTGVREARTSMLRLRRASSTGERGTA
jgi:hypothetical protein